MSKKIKRTLAAGVAASILAVGFPIAAQADWPTSRVQMNVCNAQSIPVEVVLQQQGGDRKTFRQALPKHACAVMSSEGSFTHFLWVNRSGITTAYKFLGRGVHEPSSSLYYSEYSDASGRSTWDLKTVPEIVQLIKSGGSMRE